MPSRPAYQPGADPHRTHGKSYRRSVEKAPSAHAQGKAAPVGAPRRRRVLTGSAVPRWGGGSRPGRAGQPRPFPRFHPRSTLVSRRSSSGQESKCYPDPAMFWK
ncbi:hypothetical protein GCM10010123_17740 [Pilimelia anulata]|uniref:Uncharacterized protein n=1 Tax=Pilimelia anulata TaxID=53371 RepID=A0A8J3B8T3_9ACTN|nr:hypothetical protein GCM10010123_17740 [Pilimelia anulata]